MKKEREELKKSVGKLGEMEKELEEEEREKEEMMKDIADMNDDSKSDSQKENKHFQELLKKVENKPAGLSEESFDQKVARMESFFS